MWTKSHTLVTREVTKEQLWKLFSDVDHWHTWDAGVEYARLEGKFEAGSYFILKPKKGPKVRIQLVETIANKKFVDCTAFPLAKMYGEHTYEETPEGVRMTTTMTVVGPLSFLWRRIVAQDIADGLPTEMVEQVKAAKKL
jgi:hypothetical protein